MAVKSHSASRTTQERAPDNARVAPAVMPFVFQEFEEINPAASAGDDATIDPRCEAELDLSIELGRAQMRSEDLLKLSQGAVVALDKLAGEPVDIVVAGRPIARGELLVLDDHFCVRVSELIEMVP